MRDGSLLIVDSQNSVVRQVTTDGTISRAIGTGRAGISGEGGPAANAQLFVPQAVAVSPDKAVYVADTFNERIVKMSSSFSPASATTTSRFRPETEASCTNSTPKDGTCELSTR